MKFKGTCKSGKREVWVDDGVHPVHILVHRRPVSFNWGSNGEGAYNLALSMLAEFIPADIASRHCQAFKEHFVNHYPNEWEAEGEDVVEWLAQRMACVGDEVLYDADMCSRYEALSKARGLANVEPILELTNKETL